MFNIGWGIIITIFTIGIYSLVLLLSILLIKKLAIKINELKTEEQTKANKGSQFWYFVILVLLIIFLSLNTKSFINILITLWGG